jgi:putative iron-dependent peroxidase
MRAQAAVLHPVPALGSYALFQLGDRQALKSSLQALAQLVDGDQVLAGLGQPIADAVGRNVPGLRTFPDLSGHGVQVPSTPTALMLWVRTDQGDRGTLLHRLREVESALAPGLVLERVVDAFRHREGRDLTGYEDGTENPEGDAARGAALLQSADAALDGSSYMAVQQWLHDFRAFDGMSGPKQDESVGRRRCDNEELDDAPESAHVKRTAQESFAPEAFVLRRSMPWALGQQAGLMFVAFGKSFDAFEAQMRRMAGHDDGITDALFGFSRPVSGAYFWCPPMQGGQLNLAALGL